MKINKIHTDGYYLAKISRNYKRITGFMFISVLGFLLSETYSDNFGVNMKAFSIGIFATFSTLAVINMLILAGTKSLRRQNGEKINELVHYGIKIPCRISLIEKKGSLEEYVIHITGTDGYGISHDFRSDPFFKNPGDYISEGDELTVYADRENKDIYYIRYPDTFPVDGARFYIY